MGVLAGKKKVSLNMHDIKVIPEVEARLTSHEQVCAQRYENIEKRFVDGSRRMQRIEWLLYITIAAVLLGPGVAAMFVKKLLGI
jgi:hypothetical protein